MVFLGFSEIPSLLSFVTDHALGASELWDSLSWLQVWLPGKWHLEMDLREVSGGVPSGTTPVGEGGWGGGQREMLAVLQSQQWPQPVLQVAL